MVAAVLSLSTQTFLGHNQETYQHLRQALRLSLRRQLLLVVCDDSELQSQLVQRLTTDLADGQRSPLVTLQLDGQQPDLVRQILIWLKQHRHLPSSSQVVPTFQILGVEALARQSLTVQNRFLASLSQVDALLTQLDCRLLVWLSRPWLGKIRQSVPGFWRSRSGLFEFVGDPTPVSASGAATASAAGFTPDLQSAPQPEPPASILSLPPQLLQDRTLISYSHYLQELEEAQAGPLTRARAYLAAAQFCRDRVETGATAPATLDFAISLYHKAMPGLPEGGLDWCDALNDLASLYWLHSQCEHHPEVVSLWLSRSVAAYRQALAGAEGTVPTPNLKRLYTNLGTVYSLLANVEDPLSALQQSVRAFHQALQYIADSQEADDYADLQNSLGSTYWRLAQLDDHPQPYLHQAITAYQEALHQRSPQTHPQDYAMLQNNLGIAYWSLAQYERPVFFLEQAISAYQSALAYRTLATSPIGCASTQNNLGTAYWDLAQHQSQPPLIYQETLGQALQAYQMALRAVHQVLQQDPTTPLGFDLAATYHSAGVVQDQLVQVGSGSPDLNSQEALQGALEYYLQAYAGWQQQPQQLDILGQAVARHLQLTFERLGMGAQQAVLSRLPGELLARVIPGPS
ncbi:MAG: tetratricopeptide repeat protein [Cyanobacteriota bacterium]|nr:tetratricopeptide repeat protein [Cyanobacteriota bacterium]